MRYTLRYDTPDRRPIIIGGWSKADNVGSAGNYCIYLDIFFEDGTPWWGKQCSWNRGTHPWQYNGAVFSPPKPVKEIQVFVFLRHTTGTAWFDDIFLARGGMHVTGLHISDDWPHTARGLYVRAHLTEASSWRLHVLAPDETVLATQTGTGNNIDTMLRLEGTAGPARLHLTAHHQTQSLERTFPIRLPERPANSVHSDCVVWLTRGSRKVYPTELPPQNPPGHFHLGLARNEHEGLQVSVRTADNYRLEAATVQVGSFSLPDGTRLPDTAFQTHVVGYVRVSNPSGHPAAPAVPSWCPDPLLPAHPVDVLPGRTQTFWVDVHAKAETTPGTYTGTLRLEARNHAPVILPLTIEVAPIVLPRTPAMRTAFSIMENFTRQTYGSLTPRLRRQSLDIMLDHRLNPDDISRYRPPRIEDLLYARKRGMNTFNILNLVPEPEGNPLWVCYVPLSDYSEDFTERLARRLDPVVAELRRHDLAKIAYVYGFDERRRDYDPTIRRICRFIKERYPEVSTFTTAGYMFDARANASPDDRDYMDWYCPLTPRYRLDLARRLRRQGKQVWWYVCCGPHYPYANFAGMDYPSIEGRLLAWMTYAFEVDGLLYWHVNYWSHNAPIDGDDPYLSWSPTFIAGMTGDGVLVYPHKEGLISSIRLENVRDGIEDYEVLTLLEKRRGRDAAMAACHTLIDSMTQFSRDPDKLEAVRRGLDRTLSRRDRPRNPDSPPTPESKAPGRKK